MRPISPIYSHECWIDLAEVYWCEKPVLFYRGSADVESIRKYLKGNPDCKLDPTVPKDLERLVMLSAIADDACKLVETDGQDLVLADDNWSNDGTGPLLERLLERFKEAKKKPQKKAKKKPQKAA